MWLKTVEWYDSRTVGWYDSQARKHVTGSTLDQLNVYCGRGLKGPRKIWQILGKTNRFRAERWIISLLIANRLTVTYSGLVTVVSVRSDACSRNLHNSSIRKYIRAVVEHSILGSQTSSWLQSSYLYASHYWIVLLYRLIWIPEGPCYLHVRAERTNMMSSGTRATHEWRCLRYVRQVSCSSQGCCSNPHTWVILQIIQGSVMDTQKSPRGIHVVEDIIIIIIN